MRMISIEDLKRRIKEKFCNSCSTPYKDTDIIEMGEYCCDMVSDTMAFVDELPTIEAAPVKHGRWEYDHTIGGMKHYRCTNCKNSGNECIADENEILWWNFCPRCGCKLDLGGDNNE